MGKLEAVGAKVVGVVLNRVRGSASAQDAYGDAYLSAERDSAVPPAADVEPVLSGSAGANGPAQGDLPQRVLVRTPAPGSRDGLEGTMARPRGGAGGWRRPTSSWCAQRTSAALQSVLQCCRTLLRDQESWSEALAPTLLPAAGPCLRRWNTCIGEPGWCFRAKELSSRVVARRPPG